MRAKSIPVVPCVVNVCAPREALALQWAQLDEFETPLGPTTSRAHHTDAKSEGESSEGGKNCAPRFAIPEAGPAPAISSLGGRRLIHSATRAYCVFQDARCPQGAPVGDQGHYGCAALCSGGVKFVLFWICLSQLCFVGRAPLGRSVFRPRGKIQVFV